MEEVAGDWVHWARPEQLPPKGDWTTWLLMGGRGAGKTRAGSEWVRGLVNETIPVSPIALVGETIAQARAIMVEGESGLLRIGPAATRPKFERSANRLLWPNGAMAELMSGSEPERFRGPQFAAAWCDELGKWPNAEAAWDMLQFALRLGENPRQLVTTTPRPTRLLKRLLADPRTHVTRMRTAENAANLAPGFLETVVGRYRGTVLGRQELDGELIEDLPDALWQRAALEAGRLGTIPELSRIIVGVDPPVTGHAKSDACGIIVAGLAGETGVVLADRSLKPARPLAWARRVVSAFEEFEADAVVAEVNQGGELVVEMLRQMAPHLPVRSVHATRGKWVRAEPVAALYARGLVRHAAGLAELEDEMCAFGPDGLSGGHSPDRVDALVWALTELMLGRAVPRVRGV
ncbi:terminase family protein [Mariluticola halotolerans]|nr:terminase family protein [Mariluticola halotolerans]UJQ95949.1 terminase family protein [Mariluticola halotolerans]